MDRRIEMYLETEHVDVELPRGLGARHTSAAAITAKTDSLAVTVSESTGDVRAFSEGKILIEIEKPHPIGKETAEAYLDNASAINS
ncbi:MAG: diadenylate cyclase [Planctomycetes bacterium]|nr:diadenylate cyclase [Planctomycetota bacterium]